MNLSKQAAGNRLNNSVRKASNLRSVLGRARLAVDFVSGRQAMSKGVIGYDDDVWIVSYPKSGNTWTRFLIANLVSGGETVDWSNIERWVPDIYINRDPQLRALPRPRYLKSHEGYRPDYRRVVLIVRDPRDVAISYYYFFKKSNWLPKGATMDDFIAKFIDAQIDPYGSWGENVGSWLGARSGSQGFIVIRYEDLLEDAEAQLARVAAMLNLPSDRGRLRLAVENSRADRMRELEQSQRSDHKYLKTSRKDIPFVRVAKSGQWRTELPAETARRIETAWGRVMRELGYSK